MDMMDDEALKKSVIDQMMGELDDETSSSLKKSSAPVKGVEIAITVSPKSDEMPEAMSEGGEVACPVCEEFGCANPDHKQMGGDSEMPKDQNYIQDLLKSLDDDVR